MLEGISLCPGEPLVIASSASRNQFLAREHEGVGFSEFFDFLFRSISKHCSHSMNGSNTTTEKSLKKRS